MLDSVVFGGQTCRLGGLGAPFWHPGVPFWGYGGPAGHPIGHLWIHTSIFIDFWWILGPSWNPLWGHFGDFFRVWTHFGVILVTFSGFGVAFLHT